MSKGKQKAASPPPKFKQHRNWLFNYDMNVELDQRKHFPKDHICYKQEKKNTYTVFLESTDGKSCATPNHTFQSHPLY